MNDLASSRGFHIERPIYRGPNLLWLRGGSLWAGENRISILIIVPRPKPRHNKQHETNGTTEVITAGETLAALQEPPSKGIVRSPIAGPLFAESLIECQVGDVIVLEGREGLHVRTDGKEGDMRPPDIRLPRGICMLSARYRTSPAGGTG